MSLDRTPGATVVRSPWFIAVLLVCCARNGGTDGGAAGDERPDAVLFSDAGSPTPKSYPAFTGGSRLHAMYLVPTDGARQFAGLYDARRAMKCDFAIALDGKLRCLPAHGEEGELRDDTYTDQCAMRLSIGFSRDTCSKARFAVGPGGLLCRLDVRPLGMARTGPVYVMGQGFGLACTEAGVPMNYFEVGPSIEPEQFVDAELVTDRSGARLGAVYAMASDGTRVLRWFFDTALGAACKIDRATGVVPEVMWCVPGMKTSPNGFADAGCTIPVATTVESPHCASPEGPPAAVVQSWRIGRGTVCDLSARFFEIGEPVAPPVVTYALDQSGGCTRAPDGPPGGNYVRAGRELRLPELRRDPVPGPGRLLAVDYVDDEGIRTPSGSEWLDQSRNELCEFKTAADDQTRCLPRAVGGLFYSDSACTQRLTVWKPTPCGPDAPATVSDSEATSCGWRFHIYQRGARLPAVPGTLYIHDGNGKCAALAQEATEAYDLGPELPATTFVAGSFMIE